MTGGLSVSSVSAASANLVVSATQPPNPLAPATPFVSQFSVTNSGDAASASSVVKIVYPRKLSSSTYTRTVTVQPGVTCTWYTPAHTYVNTTGTCTVPPLAPGASMDVATVSYVERATVPAAGLNAWATFSGPTNSVRVDWQWRVAGLADLTISVSSTPSPVIIGRAAVATVAMQNLGFATANGVGVHVNVPGTVTAVSIPGCTFVGGDVDCVANLVNGGFGSFTINYDSTIVVGTHSATASIDAANTIVETNETNNTATGNGVTVTNSFARLHSSIVNPTQAVRGTTFTRTVTVSNDGTIDAQGASFNDRDTVTRFVSATGPTGTSCAAAYVTGQFNRVSYSGTKCTLGVIPAGGSVSIDILLSVAAGTGAATSVTDTVLPYSTTFQDTFNNVTTAVSTLTIVSPTSAVAPTNTVLPKVTGVAKNGSTLTTTAGTWVGTAPVAYVYKWQRCAVGGACSDIANATASTYVLQDGDVGNMVRSTVTATNAGGTTSATSLTTLAVIYPPSNTLAPTLVSDGGAQVGSVWSVTNGTWVGAPTVAFSYQWKRCSELGASCINIAGATSANYTAQDADAFHTLVAQVTGTNADGSVAAVSNVSAEISPLAPLNLIAPFIDTTMGNVVGTAWSMYVGAWFSESAISYAQQWQRCDGNGTCADIEGATDTAYTLAEGDVGFTIQARVTASNIDGSATATSGMSGVVELVATDTLPINTLAPALIPGANKQVSYEWGVTEGEWTGTPMISYQWQRCDVDTNECFDIDGATAPTYTLDVADLLHNVQVLVTATNGAGSTIAYSDATGEVDPYEIP